MALGQLDAVVGDWDHPYYVGEKSNPGGMLKADLLNQVLLCFALIGRLSFLGLFELFHQVTPAIAMHPGFVPVFTKFGGDIIPVECEAGIHKVARKSAA
jgi:hypothetical protein